MNADSGHQGISTLLAAFGLAALPPHIHKLTVKALQAGSSMTELHEAAAAIANEAPVTCLQGVIGTLLFLAQDQGKASPGRIPKDGDQPVLPHSNNDQAGG